MNEPPRVVTMGETCEARLALSPKSVKAFAALVNDMNPLHHDEAYAAASRFGGLIASGTQPAAHFMALLATHFSQYAQPLGLDFDVRMKRAVLASDTLAFSWRVIDAWWKPSLNGDIVKLAGTVTNQQGDTLIVGNATILVMPASAPHSAAAGQKGAENARKAEGTVQTAQTANAPDGQQAVPPRSAPPRAREGAQAGAREGTQTQGAQTQGTQIQGAQTQDVRTQSAQARNVQAQDTRAQDTQTRNTQARDTQTQDARARDTQAQNAQTRDIQAQDTPCSNQTHPTQRRAHPTHQVPHPPHGTPADRAITPRPTLPASISVFERGWLSSNNVLLVDDARAALVDTGYATHGAQTVARVRDALGARALDLIVNTHLHSDHCGGNAQLQATWPGTLQTLIPATCAPIVRDWDEARLTFRATGQTCARFGFTGTLAPGARLTLGGLDWQTLAAPGHDPDALMLYSEQARLLVSADALWENGFGVIFPALEDGKSGFAEQQATLERIASLDVDVVIPGHGAPFANVAGALDRAFARLARLRAEPARNAKNALKVLVTFKLLEVRSMRFTQLLAMLDQAAIIRAAATMLAPPPAWPALVRGLVEELAKGGVLRVEGESVVAVMPAG